MTKLTSDNIIEKIKINKNFGSIIKSLNKNEELKNIIIINTSFLTDVTIHERLYCIKHNIISNLKCVSCNVNNQIFCNFYKKYNSWCDNKLCKNNFIYNIARTTEDKEKTIEKRKKTFSEFDSEKKEAIKNKIKNTNIEKFGVDNYRKTEQYNINMLNNFGYITSFSNKETQDKIKKTILNKYGVESVLELKEIQNKIEKTFLQKYGYNKPSKNTVVKNKIIKTNNFKYGGNSPMSNIDIQNKSKETHLSNYEFYGLSNPEILAKYKATMLSRYGYENVLQDDEIFNKIKIASKQYKDYIFPSGKHVYVQGYEDYVITKLLNKYNEDDIIINNKEMTNLIGKIYYEYNNTKHKYYPDIYIKSTNTIIEVKSMYTYNKDLAVNNLKKKACENMNLNFEFVIIDKKEYQKWKKQNDIKNVK